MPQFMKNFTNLIPFQTMASFLIVVFFLHCAIFIVMSIPLHSYLLRPKVQSIVKLILDFKVIRVCGVTFDFLTLHSIYCIYQILFYHPREPLFWSNIMLYYCIHSYYKLRCKYENIRDLHLKCENKSNSTLEEYKSTDVKKHRSSDE